MILVGTSGFQYRDWVPVFYPRNLEPRFWLQYYSRHFGYCELGMTYYRVLATTQICANVQQEHLRSAINKLSGVIDPRAPHLAPQIQKT